MRSNKRNRVCVIIAVASFSVYGLDMKKIESIDDLKPAPYNPRTIKDKAAKGLSVSIREFGDISGITWNSKTGNLVTGHQRVSRLKSEGAVFDNGCLVSKNGKKFPVRVVDWPIEKEKAANVAANNPAIGGEYTKAGLSDMLAEIKLDLGEDGFDAL